MQFGKLYLFAFAFLLANTADATISVTGVAGPILFGGLAILKRVALQFLLGGKGNLLPFRLFKRSVPGMEVEETIEEEEERFLISTVESLDPNGCILKLICHLQFKEEITRNMNENTLVDMFVSKAEAQRSFKAPFVFASKIGIENTDPAVCDSYFSKCPLTHEEVSGLLEEAWGCGF